ncbi:MAG: M20/M25/M40 family metallo-hydrolase [Candidatus Promineifilaceae bacterium]|nr:M20/M25/M40 family metallo-hydrolase [Candidatus Promineifilaceae bacterium]
MNTNIPIDTCYLIDTLKDAIRINSVIPREEDLAQFIAAKIRELGLEPQWHEVSPGRPNVYASAVLGPVPRFITFTGHLDTVGVAANWPSDPFEPIEKDGRIYGLGSADMKAGVVCALAAFKALWETADLHPQLGRIGFAATVDEEGYGSGARALLETEYGQSDALLLSEPFYGAPGMRPLPLGMTGKVLLKLIVRGRSSHALMTEGVNAVEDAAKIVAALDQMQLGEHPLIGRGNYSTLKFEGGYKEYSVVVPEYCEVIISRLTVPGESRQSVVDDLRSVIDSLNLKSAVTIETPPPFYEPYILDQETPLVQTFDAVYRDTIGREPIWGMPPGITDANIYVTEGGIPTITCGPNGNNLHAAGEYVEIATLVPVARMFAETAVRFCSES